MSLKYTFIYIYIILNSIALEYINIRDYENIISIPTQERRVFFKLILKICIRVMYTVINFELNSY